jgi:hypothetical protein
MPDDRLTTEIGALGFARAGRWACAVPDRERPDGPVPTFDARSDPGGRCIGGVLHERLFETARHAQAGDRQQATVEKAVPGGKVTGDEGSTGVVTVTQTTDNVDVTLKLNQDVSPRSVSQGSTDARTRPPR